MLALRQTLPGPIPSRRGMWPSPAAMPRRWLATAFTGGAAFALVLAVVTDNQLHRIWGIFAACSYVAAAAVTVAGRRRAADLAIGVSLVGSLMAPLGLMAALRLEQPEVRVINSSVGLLIHHGSPYPGIAMLTAAHSPNVFDPYLPLMTVFGLARALLGACAATDPRVWLGVGFVGVFAASLAVAGVRDVLRWTALVAASPLTAFSLSVGGTDMPVLACECLGLALLARRRVGPAGLALGIAAATKATAWPALVVAAVLVAARDGKRAALIMSGLAWGIVAVLVVPVTAAWPRAFLLNTVEFPLGLAHLKSQAVSPLPGRLLAETGPAGHLLAVVLLALAGAAVAGSLLIRPPRTVPAATRRLAIGLALMITLAPATRFGYLVYPAGLLIWLAIWRRGSAREIGEIRLPSRIPVGEPRLPRGERDDVPHGLGVVLPLPGRREIAQGLDVARPVRQFDQDGLARSVPQSLQAGFLDSGCLLARHRFRDRDPADHLGYLGPEGIRYLRQSAWRVLDHIVQHRRAQNRGARHPGAADQHFQRFE